MEADIRWLEAPGVSSKIHRMKRIKAMVRAGERIRPLRLKTRDMAIVFELSNGQIIEVDLMESSAGNLLLRAHTGEVTVAKKVGSLEVSAAE